MKRLISQFVLLLLCIAIDFQLKAQGPPMPPSGGHGSTTNNAPAPGGSAPIGSGTLILLGLGAAYSLIKMKNEKLE